jgi:hypothetical protein
VEVVHARCGDRYLQAGREGLHLDHRGRPTGQAHKTVTTWGSVTGQVLALRDHLLDPSRLLRYT